MSQVVEAMGQTKPTHEIIEDGHVVTRLPMGQAGGIFSQADISTVMQAVFDAQILSDQREQLFWIDTGDHAGLRAARLAVFGGIP